jgi:predicted GIY-YIG superfamily endonuclease
MEKMDRKYDNRPEWAEAYENAENVLYVGEAGDVMYRLEDHAQRHVRKNALKKIGCEPVSIEAIEYHDSKDEAEEEEYNTAVSLRNQTPDGTIVLCNGELI